MNEIVYCNKFRIIQNMDGINSRNDILNDLIGNNPSDIISSVDLALSDKVLFNEIYYNIAHISSYSDITKSIVYIVHVNYIISELDTFASLDDNDDSWDLNNIFGF